MSPIVATILPNGNLCLQKTGIYRRIFNKKPEENKFEVWLNEDDLQTFDEPNYRLLHGAIDNLGNHIAEVVVKMDQARYREKYTMGDFFILRSHYEASVSKKGKVLLKFNLSQVFSDHSKTGHVTLRETHLAALGESDYINLTKLFQAVDVSVSTDSQEDTPSSRDTTAVLSDMKAWIAKRREELLESLKELDDFESKLERIVD